MEKVEKTSRTPKKKQPAKVVNPRQSEPNWRLALIHRQRELGSIKQACEEFGVSRPTFYKLDQLFSDHGAQALEDHHFVPKLHPRTTPIEDVEEVMCEALDHPTKSSEDLIEELRHRGVLVKATTLNKILREQNMGRAQRRRANW